MRWTNPWFFGGIACALLNACGDDADGAGPGGGGVVSESGGSGGGGGQPPTAELVFGPCPAGYVDECATLAVPLDHETPDGETIELFIARRRSAAPASRQLWLLSGGPGQAGYVFETLVPVLADAIPGTDVYVVDHRGTGRSHRLTCAAQEGPNTFGGYALPVEQVPACLDELRDGGDYDRLAYFTTTQAARDVLAAVRATRPDGKSVFVYGGSYGTHWAHRVVQLEQGEIAGVFFDGFMTPEAFSFTHYDEGVEEVGAILSAACAEDASCAARLGSDPLGRAEQLWSALDADPCGPYDGELGRTVVSLFVDQGFYEKAFVFPLIHRLERCSAEDLAAIEHLVDTYFGALGAQTAPPLNSGILQYNIVLSELWSVPGEPERTPAELEAAAEAQTFLVQASYPAMVAPLRASWPLPPDDYTDLPVPAPTSKPLLWLSGGLDS
ncbi:MAG: alpha/beta fold hydrolase [Myxococcales bacterium]|nr:alpha/beta fold hydrolase [Myxococcales bacterium]